MTAPAPAPTPPWPGQVGTQPAPGPHAPPGPPGAHRPPGPPGGSAAGQASGRGNADAANEGRPHPLAVVGAIAWKAALGGYALSIGLYDTSGQMIELGALTWLTMLSNVVVGVVYLLLAVYPLLALGRRTEPRSGWLRGSMTVSMVFVMAVWLSGMGGFDDAHGLVPMLVLADWLLVGRNQSRTKAWEPLTWPVLLVMYLIYYKSEDLDHYPDVLGEDDTGFIVGGIAFIVAIGYVFWGLAYIRIRIGDSMRKGSSAAGPGQPGPGQPGPGQPGPGQPGPGQPGPGFGGSAHGGPPPGGFGPVGPGAQGQPPGPYPQAMPGPGPGPGPSFGPAPGPPPRPQPGPGPRPG